MDILSRKRIYEIVPGVISFNDSENLEWVKGIKKKRSFEIIDFSKLFNVTLFVAILSNFDKILNSLRMLQVDKIIPMFLSIFDWGYSALVLVLSMVIVLWVAYLTDNSIDFEIIKEHLPRK